MTAAQLITTEMVAGLFEITSRRVRQLAADGTLPRTSAGKFPLAATVQAYVRFLRDETRRSSQSAAAARRDDQRADLIALQIEERSGALIREARQQAIELLTEAAGRLKASIYAVPARATDDLPTRRRMDGLIEAAFADLSAWAGRNAANKGRRHAR